MARKWEEPVRRLAARLWPTCEQSSSLGIWFRPDLSNSAVVPCHEQCPVPRIKQIPGSTHADVCRVGSMHNLWLAISFDIASALAVIGEHQNAVVRPYPIQRQQVMFHSGD